MKNVTAIDVNELRNLASVGASDSQAIVSPDSSAVLCSITVSVLTSPYVTASISAVVCGK